MTEAEWLNCNDPHDMLRFVKGHRGMRKQKKQRQQRLFSVGCCRRIWSLIPNGRSRFCVEVAERFADGNATVAELRAADKEASGICTLNGPSEPLFSCAQVCYENNDGQHVSTTTMSAVFNQLYPNSDGDDAMSVLGGRRDGACPSEAREQCRLLRDIFGNPFRPVAFDPVWRSEHTVGLAAKMYEDREFAAMPILADALLEAGCENSDLLTHCREPGVHVRGCWVVDLILGKQ